ncbi:hypothetical protein CU669_05535 [Paramagnetospirillum kuznetsovii]|uniref:Tyr recombinase domain-containing protein n=2 Tax=Paramagnetospirillum kuznetsovii TaxID=2053833 RepID=A0A364P0H8_9PROT|nr:hypothetical protein CU669_05535 [Paramagnetospirillum kuznetsovii]
MDEATVARLEDDRMMFKAWLALMLGTGIRPGKEQHDDQNGKNHLFLTIQKDTKTGYRREWESEIPRGKVAHPLIVG